MVRRNQRERVDEQENAHLVVPSGSVFRLAGRILNISFLDHKGAILPTPSEKWETKSMTKFSGRFIR